MKILPIIFPALLACGAISAQGTWKLTGSDALANLGYDWVAKSEGAPSVDGLTKILATRNKNIPLKHVGFWAYFNNDSTIQGELLKEFKSSYPELLADALQSSGNMHNPKVLPLRSKFSECLLKTPTLSKINEAFLAHGYSVTRIDFEKFTINKDKPQPTFFAVIWLILEPKIDTNEEAEQAVDGKPH